MHVNMRWCTETTEFNAARTEHKSPINYKTVKAPGYDIRVRAVFWRILIRTMYFVC